MPQAKHLDRTFNLLRDLDRAATPDEIAHLLVGAFRGYGVSYVMAGIVPEPGLPPRRHGGFVLASTMPEEWARRYVTRGYALHDPTVRRLCTSAVPFEWNAVQAETPVGGRVMDEATEFGIRAGLTIPFVTLDGEPGGISFSGAAIEIEAADRIAVNLVATYAVGQLLLMNSRPSASEPVRLSPRERETLQWAAEGKTDAEIGMVMGITASGVDYHLRSARTKLDTVNKAHTVAQALRAGLIT
ncbi:MULTISPECIES: autoinducer binding domain-containing protein [unclassified Methylobacterium]|uniref:autoinducer binding domain-containing protein n=1 Tax=unclassified Methylobacterium TaxID=2615210 RepID=UPI0011C1F981|nr:MULTISPECIES: autoinducer binding domain-containing protein [unclassified Methylobacterium]QEE42564.1 LuxR family transcriptional regulator [Methylobacterium sp. WL1]TXN58155.1 LuxR family transcriptional regulator [Methylobacterium sp. WL2]